MYIQRLFLRFTSAPTQSVIYDQKMYVGIGIFLWNGRKSSRHSYDRVYDIRSFVKRWPELLVRITSVVVFFCIKTRFVPLTIYLYVRSPVFN